MDHSDDELKQAIFREKISPGEGVAMKLEQRLRALESRSFGNGHVILRFADGSTRRIPGGEYLLDLLTAGNGRANLTLQEQQHLDWIRECVAALEPGEGRITEVLKIMLHGPAKGFNR